MEEEDPMKNPPMSLEKFAEIQEEPTHVLGDSEDTPSGVDGDINDDNLLLQNPQNKSGEFSPHYNTLYSII